MKEHIKITEYPNRNLIVIKVDDTTKEMHSFVKDFYTLILERIFEGNDVNILNFDPLKDALSYDIGEVVVIKVNKKKVLVNNIQCVNSDILMQVAHSLEFELGTLAVIKKDSSPLEEVAGLVHHYINGEIEDGNEMMTNTFCYCERDGYILYLANTGLTEMEIKEIAKKV
ncbi:hypothetical protein A4H97_17905 [Niastella yeongjuensis]|uniref:Uncharacterized protein n=1 Tax=Niastella yeongjuensis TaxID=354355 RepID=A0A1V9DXJ8_9BACT|nr:hypothetical protein [Niastella yeongjuensis]OQP38603.1 hypothetical protein A4H97_17905 [Niastella yeongjuensis]SEO39999.1 hypothetical protein SAMN05660816_02822 [Niastella yeongjuensis]